MAVNVDYGTVSNFVLDYRGEVKSPINFEHSGLSESAKNIFKELAKYVLTNDIYTIPKEDFSEILSRGQGVTKKKLFAIAELQSNHYIEIQKGN